MINPNKPSRYLHLQCLLLTVVTSILSAQVSSDYDKFENRTTYSTPYVTVLHNRRERHTLEIYAWKGCLGEAVDCAPTYYALTIKSTAPTLDFVSGSISVIKFLADGRLIRIVDITLTGEDEVRKDKIIKWFTALIEPDQFAQLVNAIRLEASLGLGNVGRERLRGVFEFNITLEARKYWRYLIVSPQDFAMGNRSGSISSTFKPTTDLKNSGQPVNQPDSPIEFKDAQFAQDRMVAKVREQVRLTPPVRLTLMARDNLVIQPIRGGVPGTPFNMTVAKAQIWTVDQELLLRTTGIHLLRGDLNGVPINFGQATGLGTLRITPGGVYEVSSYQTD